MRYSVNILFTLLFASASIIANAQITAPASNASFQTTYSSGFINSGGTNDIVYIFCGNQDESNIGELELVAPGCDISWYEYDGVITSYSIHYTKLYEEIFR